MTLSEIFYPGAIIPDLAGTTKEAVFSELVDVIVAAHPDCDRTELLASLWKREEKQSTGIASGIAIPHVVCNEIYSVVGVLGISKKGNDYDSLDKKPVHVIFMLAAGESAKENHLNILNQIFSLAVHTDALALIQNAENAQDIHAILSRFGK